MENPHKYRRECSNSSPDHDQPKRRTIDFAVGYHRESSETIKPTSGQEESILKKPTESLKPKEDQDEQVKERIIKAYPALQKMGVCDSLGEKCEQSQINEIEEAQKSKIEDIINEAYQSKIDELQKECTLITEKDRETNEKANNIKEKIEKLNKLSPHNNISEIASAIMELFDRSAKLDIENHKNLTSFYKQKEKPPHTFPGTLRCFGKHARDSAAK